VGLLIAALALASRRARPGRADRGARRS